MLAMAAVGMFLAAACTSATTSTPSTAAEPVANVSTPADAPTTAPATDPTATHVPQTDGEGDEVVFGNLTAAFLTKGPTTEKVGDVTQYRGGMVTMAQAMNDPRVTGEVFYDWSLDSWTVAGTEWGTYTLTNDGGAWTGPCTGGAWAEGDGVAWGCWLSGSGGYEGYTFYQVVNKDLGQVPVVHGVIFKGTSPEM
jgi:hypothetical protein